MRKITLLWLILGIPLLSYIIFQPTFNLALYGDDWLQLYNLWLSFDVWKTMSFFDIRSYLGAYWPQYFFLGIIRHFYGYQPQAYFAASLLLRILASISLFFFAQKLSHRALVGFLASLIFTVTAAGLQTTDWVFNLNTYAGVALLNIAGIFYIQISQTQKFILWRYLIFIVFFTLALGVVPVRMHGAVPCIWALELFSTISQKRKLITKLSIVRLILPLLIMLLLVKVGSFGGEGDILPQLKISFAYLQEMWIKGRYDVFFYLFGTLGNIALPDMFNYRLLPNSLYGTILPLFLLCLVISFLIKGRKNVYLAVVLFNLLWILTSKFAIFFSPDVPITSFTAISIGVYLVFISTLVYFHSYRQHPVLALSVIFGFAWMFFFSLLYWLRNPNIIFESTGRYMTMGAVGFAIFFSSLIFIMFVYRRRWTASAPFVLLVIWAILNLRAGGLYFKGLETNRNLFLANKTWDSLVKTVPKLEASSPSVFYFTYDNPTTAYMVLTFGFWPHAALLYNIVDPLVTPVPTDNYPELLEMVRTGEPIHRLHARKLSPVPISQVYSFDFRGGELTPTTDMIRQKLKNDLVRQQTTP